MTQIIINTTDQEIITDAETLRVKADFARLGFKAFPRDLIKEVCPHKKELNKMKWLKRARTIWQLRGRDPDILQSFKTAFNNLESE